MLDQMQVTTSVDALSSSSVSYAIGPIDPAQLHILQAGLSDGQDISLLVPAHLPSCVLNEPEFKVGYEWGYLDGGPEEEWTVPKMLNDIYLTLDAAFLDEFSLSRYAWVAGYLLGSQARLAETESTLALVGIAHLCALLSCIPLEPSCCPPYRDLMRMSILHKDALRAYRARVRTHRVQGTSFAEAQRLALVGTAQ